jgi:hypothetical protein
MRKNKCRPQPARRARFVRLMGLEQLEDRTLLNASNVFAQFNGQLLHPGDTEQIPIALTSANFYVPPSGVVLGFQAQATSGSSLDPADVQITNSSGATMPLRYGSPDKPGNTQSVVVADLPLGSYTVTMRGNQGTVGAYQLNVFLAGDVDGDHSVTTTDGKIIASLIGSTAGDGKYQVAADSNLDGIISSFDYTQWRANVGASTPLRTLGITENLPSGLYLMPDGTPVTASSTVAVSGTTNAGATVALETGSDSNFDEGQTTAGSTGAYSFTAALTPGLNTLQVRANDSFGQQAFASTKVDLDTQAPLVTLTSPTSPLTTNTNVTLTGQVTDNLSGVASLQASVDNGAYQPISFDAQGHFSLTTSLALNGSADGLHTVQLIATDHVGNVSTPLTYWFTLDTIPPAVDFHLDAASDTPPVGDGHTTDAVVTLDGTTEPNTPVVLLQTGARTTSDATGAFSFSGVALALGANTFTVQATDQAGNLGTAQHTITRDPAFDNTLDEGTRFLTSLDQTFVVPAQPSMLEFKFGNLSFDDSSPNFMKDAFEASLTDANGNSLVLPTAGSRDAFLNITERQSPVLSPNVQLTSGTVDVDLSHIAAGTQAHLQVRLVNNDEDNANDSETTTSVGVDNAQVIPGTMNTPDAVTPAATVPAGTNSVDFSTLSDGLSGGPLTLNSLVTGELGTPGQQDVYTFSLAATTLLYFDSLTDSASIEWSLSGPDSADNVSDRPFNASDSSSRSNSVLALPAGVYTLRPTPCCISML